MQIPDDFKDKATKDKKAFALVQRILANNPDAEANKEFHNVNEYQIAIEQFAIYVKELGMTYLALGLASEAGEVASRIKNVIRDKAGVYSDDEKLAILREIGDVVWYATILASEIGVNMSDVLTQNYNQTKFRYDRKAVTRVVNLMKDSE